MYIAENNVSSLWTMKSSQDAVASLRIVFPQPFLLPACKFMLLCQPGQRSLAYVQFYSVIVQVLHWIRMPVHFQVANLVVDLQDHVMASDCILGSSPAGCCSCKVSLFL